MDYSERKKKILKELQNYIGVIIGSAMFGFAVNFFILANGLAQGGFTGIAIISYYLAGFPVGTMTFILNIPVMIAAIWIWGWRFITKTFLGIAVSSVVIDLCSNSNIVYKTDDLLLAAIFGGILAGTGIGIVYINGGTTGGTDILARIANRYFGVKISAFYLLFDSVVLGIFAFIFDLEKTLYALIMLFVFSKSMDYIINGMSAAKQVMIISKKNREIYNEIRLRLRRGGTYFKTEGSYTGEHQESLVVIISKYQLFRLKTIVSEVDADAFIIVTDVHEALGEGFRPNAQKK